MFGLMGGGAASGLVNGFFEGMKDFDENEKRDFERKQAQEKWAIDSKILQNKLTQSNISTQAATRINDILVNDPTYQDVQVLKQQNMEQNKELQKQKGNFFKQTINQFLGAEVPQDEVPSIRQKLKDTQEDAQKLGMNPDTLRMYSPTSEDDRFKVTKYLSGQVPGFDKWHPSIQNSTIDWAMNSGFLVESDGQVLDVYGLGKITGASATMDSKQRKVYGDKQSEWIRRINGINDKSLSDFAKFAEEGKTKETQEAGAAMTEQPTFMTPQQTQSDLMGVPNLTSEEDAARTTLDQTPRAAAQPQQAQPQQAQPQQAQPQQAQPQQAQPQQAQPQQASNWTPRITGKNVDLKGARPEMLQAAYPVIQKYDLGIRDANRTTQGKGAKHSQHLVGNALDIDWADKSEEERQQIIQDFKRQGFKGFGVGPTTLHVDMRKNPASWSYYGAKDAIGTGGKMPAWAKEAINTPVDTSKNFVRAMLTKGVHPNIATTVGNAMEHTGVDPKAKYQPTSASTGKKFGLSPGDWLATNMQLAGLSDNRTTMAKDLDYINTSMFGGKGTNEEVLGTYARIKDMNTRQQRPFEYQQAARDYAAIIDKRVASGELDKETGDSMKQDFYSKAAESVVTGRGQQARKETADITADASASWSKYKHALDNGYATPVTKDDVRAEKMIADTNKALYSKVTQDISNFKFTAQGAHRIAGVMDKLAAADKYNKGFFKSFMQKIGEVASTGVIPEGFLESVQKTANLDAQSMAFLRDYLHSLSGAAATDKEFQGYLRDSGLGAITQPRIAAERFRAIGDFAAQRALAKADFAGDQGFLAIAKNTYNTLGVAAKKLKGEIGRSASDQIEPPIVVKSEADLKKIPIGKKGQYKGKVFTMTKDIKDRL